MANNSPAVFIPKQIQLLQADLLIQDIGEAPDFVKEIKSTHQRVPSLLTLYILPFLSAITSTTAFICTQFYPPDSDTCSPLVLLDTYDDKLFSLGALISPSPSRPWLKRLVKRILHCSYSFCIRLHSFHTNIM